MIHHPAERRMLPVLVLDPAIEPAAAVYALAVLRDQAIENKKLAHHHKPRLNWLAMPSALRAGARPAIALCWGHPMSTSLDTFDPLAVVADWLDACRWGELDALLDLYDERATLKCDCERVSLTGRKWIAAYWAPKLESKAVLAFSLNDMTLTADGVRVEYQDHEGKPVRMHFHFGPSGKILHTSCGPLGRCTA